MKKFIFIILISFLFFLNCGDGKNYDYDFNEIADEISETDFITLKTNLDFSNSTINYFDIDEFDNSAFELKEDDRPFEVVDYGPVEELPVEMKKPTIYVVFSQPVVPLSKLGEPLTDSPYMKIDPPIKGIYRWYGSKLLSFEPEEDTLPQREYTVRVLNSIKSLGGKSLQNEHIFTFHTEYLNIAEFHPCAPGEEYSIDYDDVPPDMARKLTVRFTYPVNINVIKNYLRLKAGSREYSFSVERPNAELSYNNENLINRTVVININGEIPENTEFTLYLLEGARSETDLLGRPDDVSKTFHTLKPFEYNNYSTYSYSFPRNPSGDSNPVYLKFSHDIESSNISNYIETSFPGVDLEDRITVWGRTVKIDNLPVEYESTYHIYINRGLKDIYGRTLNQEKDIAIDVPEAVSYYYFPDTGYKMLEAEFEPKIIYEYQNIFSGTWHIDSIGDPYNSFSESIVTTPYDFSNVEKNIKHFEILDLSPWLNSSGKGFVGISWKFGRYQKDLQLQVTDLGITTRYAYNKVIVMVASLSTGEPVPNAEVSLLNTLTPVKNTVTDNNGLAVFELASGEYRSYFSGRLYDRYGLERLGIYVVNGDDKAVFHPNFSHSANHFGIYSTMKPEEVEDNRLETFMFTDRGLYKPGETVTFRGIDRNWSEGNYSVYEGPYTIKIREQVYRSEPFITLTGETSDSGGFYGTLKLADDIEPGSYVIDYERDDQSKSIYFQVAHFRRLNFSVSIEKPDLTFISGDNLSFTMKSTYLAGGTLSGGEYSYFWSKSPISYSPPGPEWKDYRFGPSEWGGMRSLSSGSGVLDMSGTVQIKQQTTPDGVVGRPYKYTLEARVEDISRQEVTGYNNALVHPAEFYLGVKLESGTEGWWSTFVEKGKPVKVNYALVEPDGEKYSSNNSDEKLYVRLIHRTWKITQQRGVYGRINTNYERVNELIEEKELSLRNDSGTVSFNPAEAGSYIIQLETKDERGNTALTEISIYVTGSSWIRWQAENPEDINIIPDRGIYEIGDTAHLLVQSPLPEGKYLITVEREGIFSERVIDLEGSANTIDIPIEEDYLPVVYIAVTSYSERGDPPTSYYEPDLGKPKGYFGIVPIQVSQESKNLDVKIMPDKNIYSPGSDAEVKILITQNGEPVRDAEVTFLAVDRGVLDLIDYHVPDPINFFYSISKFPLAVRGSDSRSILVDPVTYEVTDLFGGDDGNKMETREDFRPLAIFEPFLKTDSEGIAVVEFNFPDTLTTYRSTAIVVKHDLFGISEKEIMVQNPINVKTALPRRMRVRDTAVAGVLVTNLQDTEQEVEISLEAEILGVDEPSSRTVKIPPKTTMEVPFNLLGLEEGEATLVFTVRSDVLTERLKETLIVEKPLVEETFTLIGKTDIPDSTGEMGDNRMYSEEGLVIPQSIAPGYGDITIRIDSTRLTSLSDAIDYLIEYPHGGLEQKASGVLPFILYGKSMLQFDSRFMDFDIDDIVESVIGSWAVYQHPDGGFSYWPGSYYSSPYVSVKLAHFIKLAKDNGYYVDSDIDIDDLNDYLKEVMRDNRYSYYLRLYAMYVLTLYDINIKSQLNSVLESGDAVGLSGYAFAGLCNVNMNNRGGAGTFLTRLKNFIKVGTQTIDFVETYESTYYFDSGIQQLALLLMLYNELDPGSDMMQRIVTTLMTRQRGGYWRNTADTCWALIAFKEIFGNESGEDTNFKAEVSLDNSPLIEFDFRGISEGPEVYKYGLFDEPLADMQRDTLFPLKFIKDGTGTLFYSSSITYALPSEVVLPRDEGIGVYSEILDLDGNKIEGRELELGETYRCRTIISSSKRRNYVALRIPIPSGAEILDASFVTTGSYLEAGGTDTRRWTRETVYGDEFTFLDEGYGYITPQGLFIYSFGPEQKIMDNEVRYYFDDFYRGMQEVEFLFRTTTPGVYPTPPAIASCMYEEEVFGRTGGMLIIIK